MQGNRQQQHSHSPPSRRGRLWPAVILGALLLAVAGCNQQGAEPDRAEAVGDWGPAPQWSREGLGAQPRLLELQQAQPVTSQHRPGATEWRGLPIPPEARDLDAVAPGRLLHKLVLVLGEAHFLGSSIWEQTLRIWQPSPGAETAIGVVLDWGHKDDAIAGHDLRVHMQMRDDRWRLTRIEERFHCRRGVSEAELCL